jgi:hypothetical protein
VVWEAIGSLPCEPGHASPSVVKEDGNTRTPVSHSRKYEIIWASLFLIKLLLVRLPRNMHEPRKRTAKSGHYTVDIG